MAQNIDVTEFFQKQGYTGGAMHFLVDALVEQFNEQSKGNFITMTLTDSKTGDSFEVMLSKVGGQSTTDRLSAQEAHLNELRQMLRESADTLDRLVADGHITTPPDVELDALTSDMRRVSNADDSNIAPPNEPKVTYSVNDFRRHLSRWLSELGRDLSRELKERNIEDDVSIRASFNELACLSNSFNCIYVDGFTGFDNLSDDPQVQHIE